MWTTGHCSFSYVSIPINRVGWIAGCWKLNLQCYCILCDRFYARLLQRALVVVLCLFELVLSCIPARCGQQCADFPFPPLQSWSPSIFFCQRTVTSSQIAGGKRNPSLKLPRNSGADGQREIGTGRQWADVEQSPVFPRFSRNPSEKTLYAFDRCRFHSWSTSCYILSFSGRHPSKVSVATLSCSHSSCWKVCYASRQTSFEEEVCFQRFTGGLSWIRRAALSW